MPKSSDGSAMGARTGGRACRGRCCAARLQGPSWGRQPRSSLQRHAYQVALVHAAGRPPWPGSTAGARSATGRRTSSPPRTASSTTRDAPAASRWLRTQPRCPRRAPRALTGRAARASAPSSTTSRSIPLRPGQLQSDAAVLTLTAQSPTSQTEGRAGRSRDRSWDGRRWRRGTACRHGLGCLNTTRGQSPQRCAGCRPMPFADRRRTATVSGRGPSRPVRRHGRWRAQATPRTACACFGDSGGAARASTPTTEPGRDVPRWLAGIVSWDRRAAAGLARASTRVVFDAGEQVASSRSPTPVGAPQQSRPSGRRRVAAVGKRSPASPAAGTGSPSLVVPVRAEDLRRAARRARTANGAQGSYTVQAADAGSPLRCDVKAHERRAALAFARAPRWLSRSPGRSRRRRRRNHRSRPTASVTEPAGQQRRAGRPRDADRCTATRWHARRVSVTDAGFSAGIKAVQASVRSTYRGPLQAQGSRKTRRLHEARTIKPTVAALAANALQGRRLQAALRHAASSRCSPSTRPGHPPGAARPPRRSRRRSRASVAEHDARAAAGLSVMPRRRMRSPRRAPGARSRRSRDDAQDLGHLHRREGRAQAAAHAAAERDPREGPGGGRARASARGASVRASG